MGREEREREIGREKRREKESGKRKYKKKVSKEWERQRSGQSPGNEIFCIRRERGLESREGKEWNIFSATDWIGIDIKSSV